MSASGTRPRVLHVIYDDLDNPWVGGGGAVRAFEIYRRLVDRLDLTVLTAAYPGAAELTREGVRYTFAGARASHALSRLTFARAASAALARAEYDAAVVDFSTYTPIVIPSRRPVGITVHHLAGPHARQRWGRVLGAAVAGAERLLLRRARRIAAVSEETLRQVSAIARPDARLSVVSNGVADDLFSVERKPESYLLYFGRLDVYHKGIDTLLQAFAILAAGQPVPELRLAGRGKDGARVIELARELGIAELVRVLGAVSDAQRRELLAGALMQIVPSRFEGFGMVAAEAMAAGVPVIAARAGALPEVIGDDGVLVPPGDAGALAAAIRALIEAPDRQHELTRRARAAAVERFSWPRVAERHLQFIEDIATSVNR